jgi:flagella basal body P-ring formation protein FlgA
MNSANMTSMTKLNQIWRTALALTAMLATTGVVNADEIILRGAVRLATDAETIRLADVAELRGDAATALAATVIAPPPAAGDVVELGIEQIRAALTEAGAHWGRINLTGGRVIVRSRRGAGCQGLVVMAPASLDSSDRDDRHDLRRLAAPIEQFEMADRLTNETTLRGVVTRYLVDRLGIPPEDLRVEFSGDPAVLALADGQRQIEIELLSAIDSDRVELAVRLWNGAVVEGRHSISARVQQRVATAAAVAALDRHQAIAAGDVGATEQWLPPRLAATMLDPAGAAGMVAARRLKPGEPITRQDVRGPTVIKRGERAMVRCLVGGLVIAMQAESMSDGSRGEQIEFRKIGERQTFLATVTGPGEASVDLRVTARLPSTIDQERKGDEPARGLRTSRR